MKFKTLALAALAAVSLPSFANIITHEGSLGDSELVLLVTKASGSYAQDLGISLVDLKAQLSSTGTFSQSVLGAQWDAYTAFAGTGGKWAIISVQALDFGLAPNETNVWTTVGATQALGQFQNVQVNDTVGSVGLHFTDIDNKTVGQVNGRLASANAGGNITYSDNSIINLNGNGFQTTNEFGQSTTLVHLTPSNEFTDNKALFETLKNTQGNAYSVSFDGNNVTITASVVPEPSTYAMLMAGLLAVGFVARRRAK